MLLPSLPPTRHVEAPCDGREVTLVVEPGVVLPSPLRPLRFNITLTLRGRAAKDTLMEGGHNLRPLLWNGTTCMSVNPEAIAGPFMSKCWAGCSRYVRLSFYSHALHVGLDLGP